MLTWLILPSYPHGEALLLQGLCSTYANDIIPAEHAYLL